MKGVLFMMTKINNFEMYYEISGNENGEWLLLIHGLAGSTRCWKHQMEDFNKHFKVLSLDLVGHGQSTGSTTERYSGEIIANHIRLLMDHLNIENAHLLGLSLGSIVQQYFCELFPERVISTIYASPVTKFNKLSAAFNNFSDKVFLKIFSKNTYLKLMSHMMLPGKVHEKSRKFFLQETFKMQDAEFSKWWRLVMEGNHYDFLTQTNIPALIIAGEKDFCFYSDALLLQKKYINSELKVIKDAGHVTIFQKPQEFNNLVIDFVSNLNIHTEEGKAIIKEAELLLEKNSKKAA